MEFGKRFRLTAAPGWGHQRLRGSAGCRWRCSTRPSGRCEEASGCRTTCQDTAERERESCWSLWLGPVAWVNLLCFKLLKLRNVGCFKYSPWQRWSSAGLPAWGIFLERWPERWPPERTAEWVKSPGWHSSFLPNLLRTTCSVGRKSRAESEGSAPGRYLTCVTG